MTRLARTFVAGLLVGVTALGGAWAGIGIAPTPPGTDAAERRLEPVAAGASSASFPGSETVPGDVGPIVEAGVTLDLPGRLPAGRFLVGANRTSIHPSPGDFGGDTWQTEGCFELEQANPDADHALPADGHGWPFATKDCVYLGGFGIGPVRAARDVDDGGVWVRSVAISNGEDVLVHQIVDSVGYFYRYQPDICSDCGLADIRASLSDDTGIPVDNIVIASTHSHAGPDNYGGWGGVPDWYWSQLRDSIHASALQALSTMREATIAVGSATLRDRNNERRDTYYSTADVEAVWLQARGEDGDVIATLANFAGHPTIVNVPRPRTATWQDGECVFVEGPPRPVLHADWPGAAARGFEDAYGGVGLLFEGGLGNVSVSGRRSPAPPCDATADDPTGTTYSDDDLEAEGTGRAFADAVASDIALDATTLASNDVAASVAAIEHPMATNVGLGAAAMAGAFSREFTPGTPGGGGPGAYHWSKRPVPGASDVPSEVTSNRSREYVQGCDTASAVSVRTVAGAHRIGEFGVAFGPGELFSNLVETVKERRDANVAMAVYSQANDALGYILQSFEYDYDGAGTPGEYGTQHGEYEEVFAIDHCFGDHVLQTMLDAAASLRL